MIGIKMSYSDYYRNPDWKRPPDWKFKGDWNSQWWRDRLKIIERRTQQLRGLFGFFSCPRCKTEHTGLTVTCRNCNYKVDISDEDKKQLDDMFPLND